MRRFSPDPKISSVAGMDDLANWRATGIDVLTRPPPMMEGKTLQVAREWAKAGLCDAVIAAKLRTNHRALVLASMEPGGLNTVSSATKNGVSMGKTMGLSIPETLTAMGRAIEWIEVGYVPCQSRSLGRF